MTSVLNFNTTSSSDATAKALGANSILSNAKKPSTFIIQPPSSTNDSSLLSKRFNSSLLGGLLLKKVKSTVDSSNVDSAQQSPNAKSSKDAVYDSENASQLEEEVQSPTVSNFETTEKSIHNLLMPQRSISTPIFSNTFGKASNQPSHKQVINALDTLQKKFVEFQIANLRDTLLKAQLAQSFIIPPLQTADNSNASPVKRIPKTPKTNQNDEDEPEIFYGEVEYPLLHLAPKSLNFEEIKINSKAVKAKGPKAKKVSKLSNLSSPSDSDEKPVDSLLESLIATRAGTQRSEPEIATNLKELSAKITEVVEKVKKGKKNAKNEDGEETGTKGKGKKVKEISVEKANKGEKKTKSKKGQNESLLSPMAKGKKMTERRKNKWQLTEESKEDSPSSDNN